MRIASGLLFAVALTVFSSPCLALDDGDFDPTFGDSGSAFRIFPNGVPFSIYGLDTRSDGGFVLSGNLQLLPPASVDFGYAFSLPGFGGGGSYGFDLGGSNDDANFGGVAYGPDGGFVLAGMATGPDDDPAEQGALVAYDSNAHFQWQALVPKTGDVQIDAVATRKNGDIVFAGFYDHGASSPGAGDDCLVGQWLADGMPDTGFSGNGLATVAWDLGGTNDDVCQAVDTTASGKIVTAGLAVRADGSEDFAIARFTTSGSLDSSFSGDGKLVVAFDQGGTNDDIGKAIAVDRKNRIVVAGLVETATGQRVGVVRVLEDGTLDDTFNGTGKRTFNLSGSSDDVIDVRVLKILSPPSNDIVIAGSYDRQPSGSAAFVAVLDDSGAFDTSFSGNGKQHVEVPGMDGYDYAGSLALDGGELLLDGGFALNGPDPGDAWVTRLFMHQISGDDFESGDFRFWSSHAP